MLKEGLQFDGSKAGRKQGLTYTPNLCFETDFCSAAAPQKPLKHALERELRHTFLIQRNVQKVN
jgi:hypothetical protein